MKRVPQINIKTSAAEKKFLEGNDSGFPWADGNERVIKSFNLRLPEPLHMKLEFIAKHTPNSMHAFCLEAVEQAVEKELKKLTQM